jgi:hypothetical protein
LSDVIKVIFWRCSVWMILLRMSCRSGLFVRSLSLDFFSSVSFGGSHLFSLIKVSFFMIVLLGIIS